VQEILNELSHDHLIQVAATDLLAVSFSSFAECLFTCASTHAFFKKRLSLRSEDLDFGRRVMALGTDFHFVSEAHYRAWVKNGMLDLLGDAVLTMSATKEVVAAVDELVDKLVWWVATLNNMPEDAGGARALLCPTHAVLSFEEDLEEESAVEDMSCASEESDDSDFVLEGEVEVRRKEAYNFRPQRQTSWAIIPVPNTEDSPPSESSPDDFVANCVSGAGQPKWGAPNADFFWGFECL
jgi:hypothetical protein